MSIGVYSDHQRRTAIVVKAGNVRTHAIEMAEGELVLRSIPDEQFFDRYHLLPNYPPEKAARVFLAHAGGVSERARVALNGLLEGKAT